MTVVPVSIPVSMRPFVTVCCVRKEMLLHSVISKQGIFSHFGFSKSTITIDSRNRFKAAVEENMTLR